MRRFSWFVLTLVLAAPAAAQQDTAVVSKRPMGTMRRTDKVDTVRLNALNERSREAMVREVEGANLSTKRRVEAMEQTGDKIRADMLRRMAPSMVRGELAERPMQVFIGRPRIGITIDPGARPTDRYGAYVTAVTPGGPADKAGLRAGDIIVRLAGKTLTSNDDGERRPAEQSAPGLRLIEMIAKLEAGKPVQLTYRRDGDTRTTRVTPIDDESTFDVTVATPMGPRSATVPGTFQRIWRDGEGGTGGSIALSMPTETSVPGSYRMFADAVPAARSNLAFVSAFGGPLANLELASVNEKLGSYFGTTEGVLVIDVPEKDNMGLMPGDVITAIDGRKVSSPSQFMRVLRTYEKNEEFKLQVMRQKRQESISAKLP